MITADEDVKQGTGAWELTGPYCQKETQHPAGARLPTQHHFTLIVDTHRSGSKVYSMGIRVEYSNLTKGDPSPVMQYGSRKPSCFQPGLSKTVLHIYENTTEWHSLMVSLAILQSGKLLSFYNQVAL